MPYLGNVPAEAYSQMSYQDLTGGSGTSFTLDYPVGNENEIEVFVNNVRQEPTVAYTTAGTALTMTGTIAATDDFYVVFQGKAQQTIGIPEKQTNGDYNFDSGTLFVDASTNRVGINTQSPGSTLEVAGSIQATGNAITVSDSGFNSRINLFNTGTGGSNFSLYSTMSSFGQGANTFMLYSPSATSGIIKATVDGYVTMPYQPAFWAFLNGNWTSWTPNNQTQVVPFDQAYYNIGSNYNGSTGLFTCPVAGVYVFTGGVYVGVTSVEQLWLVKNGVRQPTLGFANAGSSGDRSVGTFIVRCAANDTIGLCPYASPSTTSTVFANFHHSFFMGTLIG